MFPSTLKFGRFSVGFIEVAILINLAQCQLKPADLQRFGRLPGGFHGLQEEYTNKTIDQILTGEMGGIHGAANKMMDPSGKILAELDMMLTPEQYNLLYYKPGKKRSRRKRKAARSEDLRWTGGELPYQFVKNDFDDREIYFMKLAMTEWEKYTCVRFRPYKETDRNIVRIKNGNGCSSQLGMVGGIQELNLEPPGCRYKGLYLHEMGHAIGLIHEHQLPNRDAHIEILWENVDPQMKIWFDKYDQKAVNQYNIPYEYSSVMHYGITAFSKDGNSQTIRAKVKELEPTIGNVYRKELSFTDVKTVNAMYNCSGHCSSKIKCDNGGYVDQTCQCICPDGSSDCQFGSKKMYIDNCKNTHHSWACYMWAKQGECPRNPEFMHARCAKACGLCDVPTEDKPDKKGDHFITWTWQWMGMFVDMFPKDWTIGECKDTFATDKCQRWDTYDECLTNKDWMDINCRKTCNACNKPIEPTIATCSNAIAEQECTKKVADGGCQMDKRNMFRDCRKSCEWCDVSQEEIDSDDEAEIDENEERYRCIDSYGEHEKCKPWADSGECEANPDWMVSNCRKSCDKCLKEGDCINLFNTEKCDGWAQMGECDANPDWMKFNCQKSCKACTGTTTDNGGETTNKPERACIDLFNTEKCDGWARMGECNANPDWMKINCRKSCKECTGTNTDNGGETTNQPDVECTDIYDTVKCDGWARGGECDINPDWMIVNCRKSCNACSGNNNNGGSRTTRRPTVTSRPITTTEADTGSCSNKYNDGDCRTWAKYGHCDINPSFMHKSCMKSCGLCDDYRQYTTKSPTATPKVTTKKSTTADPPTKKPTTTKKTTTADPPTRRTTIKSTIIRALTTPPTTVKITTYDPWGDTGERTTIDPVTCFDSNENCQIWADFGFCATNPGYNLVWCRMSCQNCNGCKDEHENCAGWAKAGQCAKNVSYMLRHCQKSCKVCEKRGI